MNKGYYVSTSRWDEQGVFAASDPIFTDGVPSSFIWFETEEDAWEFWSSFFEVGSLHV